MTRARENDYSFILSRPLESLVARGAVRTFDAADAALADLRAGRSKIIVGALPFESSDACTLIEPATFDRNPTPWPAAPRPAGVSPMHLRCSVPEPDEHVRRVAKAVERIHAGELDKVVLARRVVLASEEVIDPLWVLDRLVSRDPASNGFLVDLSRGPSARGSILVGSSPEVLVKRSKRVVSCWPLAGSAPRSADPVKDRAQGRSLQLSAKDLHEHAFVVESVCAALFDVCDRLEVPAHPQLIATPQMWHLGTPITGTLRDPGVGALELAIRLHPTPAVCGTPTNRAREAISDLEGERGYYAGAVGWCDAEGDGEWMVTIRCAEISDDGRTITASAGGGIVADSEPAQELAETTAKFQTILNALGAGDVEV
ncbi:isochorismate synthase MenF [Rhodococcus sp. NPDC058514]|uniref:isochorismate synthase n=1 Tax=unclassified Rhodococcus (in: high G+C Gram-positive bacteria) TaxID=192944 RepID=UPI00364FFA52